MRLVIFANEMTLEKNVNVRKIWKLLNFIIF